MMKLETCAINFKADIFLCLFLNFGDLETRFAYKIIIEKKKKCIFGNLSYLSNHICTWYVVRSKHGRLIVNLLCQCVSNLRSPTIKNICATSDKNLLYDG